jgi:hypothetical protein
MALSSKWKNILRTVFASVVATNISAPTSSDAHVQSEAEQAYQDAFEQGTVHALERFLEQHPLAPETKEAFREIVKLSQPAVDSGVGVSGLANAPALYAQANHTFDEPYSSTGL